MSTDEKIAAKRLIWNEQPQVNIVTLLHLFAFYCYPFISMDICIFSQWSVKPCGLGYFCSHYFYFFFKKKYLIIAPFLQYMLFTLDVVLHFEYFSPSICTSALEVRLSLGDRQQRQERIVANDDEKGGLPKYKKGWCRSLTPFCQYLKYWQPISLTEQEKWSEAEG